MEPEADGWDKFAEGMAAQRDSKLMMENPYLDDDFKRYSWDSGWMTQDGIEQIAFAQNAMQRLRNAKRYSKSKGPDDGNET